MTKERFWFDVVPRVVGPIVLLALLGLGALVLYRLIFGFCHGN